LNSSKASARLRRGVPSALELCRLGREQLQHDRAFQMAAALAFRTLFGLLPVLVVATVLVKALGMEDYYLGPLGRLFAFCGLDHVRIVPPADSGLMGAMTLDVWMQERVRDAKQVNVAAIGWVGVTVTLYAAISLMVTIENCCNIIYRAPHGRAWTSRIPIYWFVLTLSPLVVIFSTYVDARFQQVMSRFQLQGGLTTTTGFAWTLFAIWLLMFTAYVLFPNTRVHPKPAMIGALVAAVILELGKRTMGAYVENALSLSQLYGSLGLVPLFMFWIYLMWVAVLFGLEVSSVLQQHVAGWQFTESAAQEGKLRALETDLAAMVLKRLPAKLRATAPDVPAALATPEASDSDVRGIVPQTQLPADHLVLQRLRAYEEERQPDSEHARPTTNAGLLRRLQTQQLPWRRAA
jgi:YihY family inner membrane protein